MISHAEQIITALRLAEVYRGFTLQCNSTGFSVIILDIKKQSNEKNILHTLMHVYSIALHTMLEMIFGLCQARYKKR